MKKLFTLLALLPIAGASFGQITINAADMPLPVDTGYMIRFVTTRPANPTTGTNQTWDYSRDTTSAASKSYYFTEIDTFYTNRGIDVYAIGFKSLIPGLGYDIWREYDFSATGVADRGAFVDSQYYDISSTTGGSGDNIIFPYQGYVTGGTGREIVHFPMTYGSSWSSVVRNAVDFNLTVSAFSMSNTACQHVYYVNRTDTVVGWGSMKLYTNRGASASVNVLMTRTREYSVDSFYVMGSPAPATLLTAFGLTQGNHIDSNNRLTFYRSGSFGFFATFLYGGDATFSNSKLQAAYVSAEKIYPAGISATEANYSTALYPNPANGNTINLAFNGKNVANADYVITDITGKTVMAGSANLNNNELKVNIDLNNGMYILSVVSNGEVVAKEEFTVAK